MTGAAIEQEGCGGQRLGPKMRRQGRVLEQSANTVIKRAQDALRFVVLLTGVGTREAKDSDVVRKQGAHNMAIELPFVVYLNREHMQLNLGACVSEKITKDRKNIIFVLEREGPNEMWITR